MKKKRWLSAIMAAAVVLTACSGGSSTSASEVAAAKTEASAAETEAAAPAYGGGSFVPGTYSAAGDGIGGNVTVTITVDGNSITDVVCEGPDETPDIGGAALPKLEDQILAAQSADIEGVTGATVTCDGIKDALQKAITKAEAGESDEAAESGGLAFTAGTYTGIGEGYNGPVLIDVTFSDSAVTDIAINTSGETDYVGTVAYDILFEDILAANGSGVDSVSGATFTSRAIKVAVNDAAEQAGVSDLDAFKSNTVIHEAQDPIEETYDIVIVGGGGAGMAAAAKAAQNGDTVLVIEENAEIGGNTLVSGGSYQSVMPYLVWDPEDPDAETAVWDYDGNTYNKVKSTQGCIDTLKIIYNWSEEPFDEDYYIDNEYVAGEISDISQHGVHAEYLPTLQALKKEIKAYLDWAEPQLEAGIPESNITLFSTLNLHIFQTYYGGLRQSADKLEWIYGDFDLVSQIVNEGQGVKEWLEDQGAVFYDDIQSILIGAIWYRINRLVGADLDGDGEAEIPGKWGAYFATTENTLLNTSETASANKIMKRTRAENLIIEDGRVTGVTAVMYDQTPVTAHAAKGVILATGGYAANISKVIETNKYWDESYITASTKTTNRSSLIGSGIDMAEEAGAAIQGTGWTQMMPISWIDNGNLAGGSGEYVVFINPTTGKRFVNEAAERDVLSLGEFRNGIEYKGSQGVFLEFSNTSSVIGGSYTVVDGEDVEDRVYFATSEEELKEILDKLGMEADPAVIYDTIEAYDRAIMAGEQPEDVGKSTASNLIGHADKDEAGNYISDTYELDGQMLRVRVMAPSTHHTMGGLVVDLDRHVLTEDGSIIEGLYAAGEVIGGVHAGNRLGGNAITEILVSGRIAADSINEDNK